MFAKLKNLFKKKVDGATLEELEELFLRADLGVQTASELTAAIAKRPQAPFDEILREIHQKLVSSLKGAPLMEGPAPTVTLVVGVNGSGKTTTIAKLAHRLHSRVIVGAADTFRAAAIDQLQRWSERLDFPFVHHQPGADPSAVAYDTLTAAVARQIPHAILDTAGRLHTKGDLMRELEKIRRVCNRVVPDAPHETLLVLDGTIGQNALDQARAFHAVTPITGLVLTKLDGTARGGVAVPLQRGLGIPIKFVGVGEGVDDLQAFEPETFVSRLLAEG